MASYKGKYPGPDVFKGDAKLNAEYKKQTKGKKLSEAAKRKLAGNIYSSSKKTAAKPAATAPKPAATAPKTPTAPASAYPSSNVSSNSSGNVQLQTNAEIESAVLDAEEQKRQAYLEATQSEQQAAITKSGQVEDLRHTTNEALGQRNATEAYRGLHGTSALKAKGEVLYNNTQQANAINNQYDQSMQGAANRRLAGDQALSNAEKTAIGRRQDYTNEQSRLYPTQGSSPVTSGLKATPGANVTSPKQTVPSMGVKSTSSKSYKGKYKGPDIFKGNSGMNAAYGKAIKGKKLTDAAKRQIAQRIYSGK